MNNIIVLGANDKASSFSQVNHHLINNLRKLGFNVTNQSDTNNINPETIIIHHNPEEYFGNIVRPPVKNFIVYRTWDFGPFPNKWVEIINNKCDQLWVYSYWVKEQAIAGGVNPEMIKVVPIGVLQSTSPTPIMKSDIGTDKSFKFLFIGATIYRKGIDILLEAYENTFSKDDDVSLIIKDNTQDVFYKEIFYKEKIIEFISNEKNPELVYIDDYLSDNAILELYNSVDLGVFPYRSEGFARPILELMGRGVPSIVPNFGPCLDYCSSERSIIIPVQKISLPVHQTLEYNTLGFEEEIEAVEFCEIAPDILGEAMHQAYIDRSNLSAMSENGQRYANENYSWDKIMEIVVKNINELKV